MIRPDDKICWQAMQERDAAYDGQFIYGVITTGIYCRPSCSSRLAKRENVRFFLNSREAEDAGLRACLRCRPTDKTPQQELKEQMRKLADYIEVHADESLPLSKLAKVFALSPYYIQRSFKAVIGVSPKEYQNAARLKTFKSSLKSGDDIAGAIFEAGFGSSSRVYEQTDGRLGMTPSAYRAGGKGETIAYAVRKTSLGPLMMAATGRGVCFVHFGKSASELIGNLKNEYPNAKLKKSLSETSPELNLWIDALDHHISNNGPRPGLPLDLNGTAFQMRVWQFLMSIKEGDVVSYTEVAKGIGSPKAVRAAASACAANNIAVLIPCHRVLRSDGSLGGYRWGVQRKRVLIDAERARSGREFNE